MKIDTLLTYSLKKEAQEKCTYEVKLRLWQRIALVLGLPNIL